MRQKLHKTKLTTSPKNRVKQTALKIHCAKTKKLTKQPNANPQHAQNKKLKNLLQCKKVKPQM